jgi:hypothetical protein
VIKILGGDSHSIFSLIKKQEFLVSLYFSISRYLDESEIFVATPHTCDRDDAENAKNDANISKNIFFRFSLIFAIFGF